jgi:hypothetical protein
MPRFGGFGGGLTAGLVGGLAKNAVGTVANAIFPQGSFGGFGLGGSANIIGQLRMSQDSTNRKASLRPKPGGLNRAFGSGLLDPLRSTDNRMIWPYTPSIQYNHNTEYQPIQTIHANQDFHVFARAPAIEFVVDGEFTIQNQLEGQYAMACLHFLRSVSKMNFGENDPNAGTPPPVLLFNAYGPFVFNEVPVILKQFTFTFPNDVDYVEVVVAGSKTVQTTPAVTVDRRIVGENLPAIGPTPVGPGRVGPYNVIGPFGSGGEEVPGFPAASVSPLRNNSTTSVGQIETITPSSSKTTQANWTVWLPSMFKISTTLVVQHTPDTLRGRFNLPAFINGAPNQSDFI